MVFISPRSLISMPLSVPLYAPFSSPLFPCLPFAFVLYCILFIHLLTRTPLSRAAYEWIMTTGRSDLGRLLVLIM